MVLVACAVCWVLACAGFLQEGWTREDKYLVRRVRCTITILL